jgi:alpha-L-fucosidase
MTTCSAPSPVAPAHPAAAPARPDSIRGGDSAASSAGAQRLGLAQLQAWESLGYGLFIHFGMSTFDGDEFSRGDQPSARYAPDRLDVDQWVQVARDAGMRYAVLTAKHVAGHCLWPSRHTDYHVGTSSNRTDVVEAFVRACDRHGIMPGLYYCSWDNHHRFGSFTPSDYAARYPAHAVQCVSEMREVYTTRRYQDFQTAQLQELLTGYGPIGEVWIDIPGVLPRGYRDDLYRQIAGWQPQAVIMMNHGLGDGSNLKVHYAWPTDLISIERHLPDSLTGHVKWRTVEGARYYVPGEVCDTIGKAWFHTAEDRPRSVRELLGMRLLCAQRGANLLLNVPPDRRGRITRPYIDALQTLQKRYEATEN